MNEKFIIFQSAGPIYGVGETLESAKQDASLSLSGAENAVDNARRQGAMNLCDGHLYWSRCTPALAEMFRACGADIVYEENDQGFMDIAV